MKKGVILALLLLVMSTGVFAMDMAFGVGGMFNMAWTSGIMKEGYYSDDWYEETDWTMRRQGFGGFVFLGVSRFLELNLGVVYKTPTVYEDNEGISEGEAEIGVESTTALLFGVYFKYPVPLSDAIVFFPTVGVDYEFTPEKESIGYIYWWDDIMIRAGLGIDIFATEKFFVRAHALYGFGFPVGDSPFDTYKNTHGLLVKVGLGWMF